MRGWAKRRVATAALAALVLSGCSFVASQRLRNEIARIRAAGEPLTFEELRGGPVPEDEDDAASDYRAAAALLTKLRPGPVFELVEEYRAGIRACPTVPPSPEVRERARRMLAEAQPAFALIDRAAAKETCHYAFNMETGQIPTFVPLHTATVLLSLRTLELAVTGDGDGAVASLISKLRMLRVFETEPTLITYLVRLAAWSQAGLDLPAVLGAAAPSTASLIDLDAALGRAQAANLLKRTIEGERVWELKQLAAMLGPDWPSDGQSAGGERMPFWERRQLLSAAGEYISVTAAMTHAAEQPWPRVLEAMPAAFPRTVPPGGSFPMVPTMERSGQALAMTRAGRVAIAVERHRRQRGQLPVSLLDLAAPRPADPFSGHDFLFDRTGDAFFAVSSIGPGRAGGVSAVDAKAHEHAVSVCTRQRVRPAAGRDGAPRTREARSRAR